jgi:hypothetical protein
MLPLQGGKPMVIDIVDKDFKIVAESVKPDDRKRVGLHRVPIQKGVSYHIYANSTGQIFLDPQVTIPASEAWVFENKNILAAIDRGMAESEAGRLIDRGSFAKYVEDAT